MFESPRTPSQFATPSRIEWGPAHLREGATTPEFEPADRPDDN